MTVTTDEIIDVGQKHLNNIALRAYSDQKEISVYEESESNIVAYLPMVKKIVSQVVTYLKPPLSFEDMVSAGVVGLVRAARDFDPSQGAEFKTYAYIKIKGAVLDELRGWSFIPANLNKQIRNARNISQKVTEATGYPPTDEELAERLGITVNELYDMLESARAHQFISIDGAGEESPALGKLLVAEQVKTPDEQIEREELIEKLSEAIKQLSQKHRQVILLYYNQHLTMKQIAEILEITESRVSQLHASALFNLSVKLRQWKDGRV